MYQLTQCKVPSPYVNFHITSHTSTNPSTLSQWNRPSRATLPPSPSHPHGGKHHIIRMNPESGCRTGRRVSVTAWRDERRTATQADDLRVEKTVPIPLPRRLYYCYGESPPHSLSLSLQSKSGTVYLPLRAGLAMTRI